MFLPVYLNSVSLPGLAPQQHDWDAGHDEGEETAEESALPEILTVPVDQAARAERAAQA